MFPGGEKGGHRGVNVASTIPSPHQLVIHMASHFIAEYTIY